MNYGGAGNGVSQQYGQTGMAPIGQQTSMSSVGNMMPGPMGQQQINMQQQQRMMMQQQNFRPMYAQQGTMPQQAPMHPQGQMYSQPSMQMHSSSKPMQQQQQQYMVEMMNRMPLDWKTNIQQEANPERKRLLQSKYMSQMAVIQNQSRMPQQGMHPSHQQLTRGVMPSGAVYNNVPMAPQHQNMNQQHLGQQMISNPMQQHSNMRPMQTTSMIPSSVTQTISSQVSGTSGSVVASHTGMHMQSQGLTPQSLAPVASPQVAQPGSHSQQMMAPSPANLSVGPTATGASPGQAPIHQVQQHHGQVHLQQIQSYTANQPNTPQSVSLPQPGSVGETGPQHPNSVQSGEHLAELNIAREEIRTKYLADLIRLRERFVLDGKHTPPGFDKLIEILEYKRNNVTAEQLRRAIVPSVRLLDQNSLGSSLTNELRQWADNDVPSVGIPDPWEDVRDQFIRVPDEVLRLCNSTSFSQNPDRKRKQDGYPVETKRAKFGNEFTSSSSVYDNSVSFFNGTIETTGSNIDVNAPIQINCEFDSKQKWTMSEKASQELSKISWRADAESLPSSSKCPDAMICFDSRVIMCAPLRVLVPKSYPVDPAVVQFDRSFPNDGTVSQQLSSMFERLLSMTNDRSLTTIYETFHAACQELMRLKSIHNGHYVPSKHQQKQLVA